MRGSLEEEMRSSPTTEERRLMASSFPQAKIFLAPQGLSCGSRCGSTVPVQLPVFPRSPGRWRKDFTGELARLDTEMEVDLLPLFDGLQGASHLGRHGISISRYFGGAGATHRDGS